MKKLLTIIVPTYNMENYLHKSLDSLIISDENMEKVEILVINDGSKDTSSQIAHEYESKYPQTFRVIDKENGNYGSCINRGLEEAIGKYVKVLDSDDSFDTVCFDSFVFYLENSYADLVINDFCIVDENGNHSEEYTFCLPTKQTFSLADIPLRMTEWLWHHGITYRTEILRFINYRQTEGISYTDDEWIFIPMSVVKIVTYYPHILYNYLMGREGQTFDPHVMVKSFDKRIIVGKSMVKSFSDQLDGLSEPSKLFMKEKLVRRLMAIYNFYLKMYWTKDGNALLVGLDSYIKSRSLLIYNELERNKDRLGINFIENWRKAGYKCTPYLVLKRMKFLINKTVSGRIRNLHMPDDLRRVEIVKADRL